MSVTPLVSFKSRFVTCLLNFPRNTVMHFACRITKARIQTHSEHLILSDFPRQQNGSTNAPLCYVIRTLPAFLPSTKSRLYIILIYFYHFLVLY